MKMAYELLGERCLVAGRQVLLEREHDAVGDDSGEHSPLERRPLGERPRAAAHGVRLGEHEQRAPRPRAPALLFAPATRQRARRALPLCRHPGDHVDVCCAKRHGLAGTRYDYEVVCG